MHGRHTIYAAAASSPSPSKKASMPLATSLAGFVLSFRWRVAEPSRALELVRVATPLEATTGTASTRANLCSSAYAASSDDATKRCSPWPPVFKEIDAVGAVATSTPVEKWCFDFPCAATTGAGPTVKSVEPLNATMSGISRSAIGEPSPDARSYPTVALEVWLSPYTMS